MTYIVILLYLLLISSGSVFACTYFNRKYEEVLPITCSLFVLLGFLLGFVNLLSISTILILLISIALYVLSIIRIVKTKSIKEVLKNIITPGFVVYLILFVLFFVAIKGKLLEYNDEFSHWGDVVKAMTTIDDFASSKLSHSIFRTYPPGMSLFQYYVQKINLYLTGQSFCEWLLYFAYYTFEFSFILPICRKFSFKKIFAPITLIIAIVFIPPTFFLNSYNSIYIDPFLSFLFCGGLLQLLWNDNHDIFFDLSIYAILFMLPLSKDVGLLFAITLAVGYLFIKYKDNNKQLSKDMIVVLVLTLLSILIPKVLWSIDCSINNAKGFFDGKIDFINLAKVFLGVDTSYRGKVLKNYIAYFLTVGIVPGKIGIEITYICLVLITITVLYIVSKIIQEKCNVKKLYSLTSEIVMIISLLIFVFGMCIVYMYKFAEEEALGLASLDRYLAIVFLAAWLFISINIIVIANDLIDKEKMICLVLICFMSLCAPLELIIPYFTRSSVKTSLAVREPYNYLIDKTLEYVDGDDNVYYISQNSDTMDRLIYRYAIRPNYQENDYWVLGKERYEGDYLSLDINAEEWKQELKEDYDYVAIYTLNDNFYDKFSSVFENENEIGENCLYIVNKETGLLSLCK